MLEFPCFGYRRFTDPEPLFLSPPVLSFHSPTISVCLQPIDAGRSTYFMSAFLEKAVGSPERLDGGKFLTTSTSLLWTEQSFAPPCSYDSNSPGRIIRSFLGKASHLCKIACRSSRRFSEPTSYLTVPSHTDPSKLSIMPSYHATLTADLSSCDFPISFAT